MPEDCSEVFVLYKLTQTVAGSLSSSALQCGGKYAPGSGNSSAPSGGQESQQPQGLGHAEDAAEHENMKAILKTSLQSGDSEATGVSGLRTRTRSRPGRGGGGIEQHTHTHTVCL